ncbi:MAG: YcxB family protein [Acutalibacteraceae bacterium]|jgi:hypothetical protein
MEEHEKNIAAQQTAGKVPDENAAECRVEEKIHFRLTEEQIYRALRSRGVFRTQGARAVVQTVLLAVLGAGFLVSYFCYHDGSGLFLGIVSFAVIAMIWLVPWLGLRSRARGAVPEKEVCVALAPENLTIGEGGGMWEFPLDGSGYCWQTEELLLLETSFGRMTVIPKNAFSAEQQERWFPLIAQKTSPEKPKRRRKP